MPKLFYRDNIGELFVEPIDHRRRRLKVVSFDPKFHIFRSECITSYSDELLVKIIEIKGLRGLCDEVLREQDESYILKPLEFAILSYISEDSLVDKRILDFGCGLGASTIVMSKRFQQLSLVGIELNRKAIEVCNLRKQFYLLDNLYFISSPSGSELPPDIGEFDLIILNAVYEHLLPTERPIIFKLLWSVLRPGGSIIINETPYRWFPVETHTTEGFPLINYLPDKITYYLVSKFSSKMYGKNFDWQGLLRGGIRDGSETEVVSILSSEVNKPKVLAPIRLGMRDRIDIFFASLQTNRLPKSKRIILQKSLKIFKLLTGITAAPTLTLCLYKDR